jgi:hypothetical protein
MFQKFRKNDLNETSTVVKTEMNRFLLDWDLKLKIINCKLNKDTKEILFPNDSLMDSNDLTMNDKKKAVDRFVNVILAESISEA